MADGLDRFIASLDASFDAAIARAEEEAASDLAFSLSQDRDLCSAAGALGPLEVVLPDEMVLPVTLIGSDFLAAGDPLDVVVPASKAVLRRGPAEGPSPVRAGERMRRVLLRWARGGAVVDVSVGHRSVRGRLLRAARDHVEVEGGRHRYLVAGGEIASVRRVLEGSAGAS